jgi:AcrR family transcriptional regulator
MNHTTPLTRESIIQVAMAFADSNGLEALSMRRLGQELGVEAMAIYHHFASKEELLEEMLGVVHGEIVVPSDEPDWRACMRVRATSVLEAIIKHPWAAARMESGVDPTATTMRDREYIARCLRTAGFSLEATVHATTLLDIYVYGAAQQYVALSFSSAQGAAKISKSVSEKFSDRDYPYFSEVLRKHILTGKYNPLDEFYFGLEVILDGIKRLK